MNKTLRYFLFCVLVTVCGLVSAQTTVNFDFTGSEAYGMALLSGSTNEYNANPYVCSEGEVTLTLNGNSRWWAASGGNELRMYKESNLTFSVPAGNVITKVVLGAKKPADFEAAVGTYENGVWTGAADVAVINCIITKNNTAITTIEVTYQASSEPVKSDPKIAFSATTASTTVGAEFTAPTLTKATTAEPVYTSSNENVAKVDSTTGVVTTLSAGTTVITATVAETDEYAAGSASYTLTVSEAVRTEVDEPYTETFETGLGSFTINDVMLGEGLSYVWKHDASFKYMKASAYNKANIASESWMISPIIKLSETEVVRYLSFDQCINKYFGDVTEEATLWIKEQGGEWKQLNITYPALPETGNWSQFETQVVSLAGYEGKNIQIGFKYTSTADAAGTWEIRNFNVNTDSSLGVSGVEAQGKASDNAVYNLAGQRLDKPVKGINIIGGKKVVVK